MNIVYVDEYGEEIYRHKSGNVPYNGDTVSFGDEDWKVKSREFLPKEDSIRVEITQNMVKSKSTDDSSGRLAEMQRAIVDIGKRQNTQEKKSRLLSEQLVTVRTHLRNKNDAR